jgi:hypothetical protein
MGCLPWSKNVNEEHETPQWCNWSTLWHPLPLWSLIGTQFRVSPILCGWHQRSHQNQRENSQGTLCSPQWWAVPN